MQLRIACIFPFTGDKQGEITTALGKGFFKRYDVKHESTPGVLKMEMKIETVNQPAGVLLSLSDALKTANGGRKFEPSVRLEPEIAMDPILV